jgi:hypothetical protein
VVNINRSFGQFLRGTHFTNMYKIGKMVIFRAGVWSKDLLRSS